MKQNLLLNVISVVIAIELLILIVKIDKIRQPQTIAPANFKRTSNTLSPTEVVITGIKLRNRGDVYALPVYAADPSSPQYREKELKVSK